jgi:glycolate oxidase iron-sulfur subunit
VLVGNAVRTFGRSRWSKALPPRLRAVLTLAPRVTWSALWERVPERTPAAGPVRLRVGLLTGCVQRLVFPRVNAATTFVLSAEGCEVVAPAAQGCCGALALHAGRLEDARAFARRLIEVFESSGADRIAVNAAGCGSSMKEYGELLAHDARWAERARAFSSKVRDVSEVLSELGAPRAPRHPIEAAVVYHDACHLAHAQGVRSQPREALRTIPGLRVTSPAEPEVCCGSAGIYNLVQPAAARELGARKAGHIAAAKPDLVVTGNPGCMIQIASAAAQRGDEWPVLHPIELVAASIRGSRADLV